jgi:hypothetical protein
LGRALSAANGQTEDSFGELPARWIGRFGQESAKRETKSRIVGNIISHLSLKQPNQLDIHRHFDVREV